MDRNRNRSWNCALWNQSVTPESLLILTTIFRYFADPICAIVNLFFALPCYGSLGITYQGCPKFAFAWKWSCIYICICILLVWDRRFQIMHLLQNFIDKTVSYCFLNSVKHKRLCSALYWPNNIGLTLSLWSAKCYVLHLHCFGCSGTT